MIRNKKLEERIYNYIKNNGNNYVDSVDIVHRFNSEFMSDSILDAIGHLRINGFIDRISAGIHYYYVTLKPYKENETEN